MRKDLAVGRDNQGLTTHERPKDRGRTEEPAAGTRQDSNTQQRVHGKPPNPRETPRVTLQAFRIRPSDRAKFGHRANHGNDQIKACGKMNYRCAELIPITLIVKFKPTSPVG
jgi:hypothetical protein